MSKRKIRKQKLSNIEKNASVSELMNENDSKTGWEPTLDLPPGYPEVQDLGEGGPSIQTTQGHSAMVNKNLIAEFKTRKIEVQLCMGGSSSLFLVPEYTDKDRLELSVDHFAMLSTFTNSATGAQIVSIRRMEDAKKTKEQESDAN